MEKVTGIGGMFFRSKSPEALAKWYEEHLGVTSFSGDSLWIQQKGPTVFAPFTEDTDYFSRPEKAWMINFRVSDLDAMLTQLEVAGVAQTKERMTEDGVGRFAWIEDPEGNGIELWEPLEKDR